MTESSGQVWADAVSLLWPGAEVRVAARDTDRTNLAGGLVRELIVFPNARRPRLLLPAGAPRAAAAALRRYSHDLGLGQRMARSLLASAVRTGVPQRALTDRLRVEVPPGHAAESMESYLGELLGQEVVISIGMGTARANRKPILQVLTKDGGSLAFVKVGDSDTTRELVRAESANLATLSAGAPLSRLAAPEVLHSGDWRGLELLVLRALPMSARWGGPRAALPVEAMTELFAVAGIRRLELLSSPYWAGVTEMPGRLADRRAAEMLAQVIQRIGSNYGAVEVELGAWHGDWTPWNMSWHRGRVQLWDWERFARGVPRGFDALHYRFHQALRARPLPPGPDLRDWRSGAGEVLATVGVGQPAVEATTELYLLELCCRYLVAGQSPIGEPLRAHAVWLLESLHTGVGFSPATKGGSST